MSDESEQENRTEDDLSMERSDVPPTAGQERKVHPVMMVFATGMVVLHRRSYRRNLLFALTLVMLAMVLVGGLMLDDALAQRPIVFALYWAICFLLLMAVLCLALYDLMRVRREHQMEIKLLDTRMSADMEKLRAEAVDIEKSDAGKAMDEEGEDSK
jgi:hypothetical protein